MEKQIRERSKELQSQFNDFNRQLQELIAAKVNIEQRITIVRENIMQLKGAIVELTALINKPEPDDGKAKDNLEK